jgi:hypothetical protein
MAPGVIASRARQVATFHARGKTRVLWVAPTRAGGFCWQLSGWFGGCRINRNMSPGRPLPGYVRPELVGVTSTGAMKKGVESVSVIGGDVLTPKAHTLSVNFADGTRMAVRFYYVSKPIDAGFYFAAIPAGHDTTTTRPVAVELLDKQGRVISRQPFRYATAAQRAREAARARATLERLRKTHPRPSIRRAPPVPAPTSPFQRGEAGGVSVVAGHNGVVVFDISGATPKVRALIGRRAVSYGCYRRLPYHSEPVGLGHYYRVAFNRVRVRMAGLAPPYDGCDIQGSYGHTWPDRNNSHSAVEVAFTQVGRNFLENRAAARDLALFVRSAAMHSIRKLDAAALERQLRTRYGSAIKKLASPTAPLAPDRIGYAIDGTTVTFVERSTTGRRFHVRFINGHIRGQNVRPFALAF